MIIRMSNYKCTLALYMYYYQPYVKYCKFQADTMKGSCLPTINTNYLALFQCYAKTFLLSLKAFLHYKTADQYSFWLALLLVLFLGLNFLSDNFFAVTDTLVFGHLVFVLGRDVNMSSKLLKIYLLCDTCQSFDKQHSSRLLRTHMYTSCKLCHTTLIWIFDANGVCRKLQPGQLFHYNTRGCDK